MATFESRFRGHIAKPAKIDTNIDRIVELDRMYQTCLVSQDRAGLLDLADQAARINMPRLTKTAREAAQAIAH